MLYTFTICEHSELELDGLCGKPASGGLTDASVRIRPARQQKHVEKYVPNAWSWIGYGGNRERVDGVRAVS